MDSAGRTTCRPLARPLSLTWASEVNSIARESNPVGVGSIPMETQPTEEVDVVVIGLGPAGETIGGRLAEAGLKVVGVEASLVGGECPYWGCVPSKMMIRAANLLAESRRVGELAGSSTTSADWAPVAARIRDQATDNWDDTVAVDRFVGKGGHFVRGRAVITAPKTVTVDEQTFVASKGIVVATGTLAGIPPIAGLADTPYWTNHDIVEAKELPTSLLILGGGAIGTELAQVMARFGVTVSVIEGESRLLPRNEPEVGALLQEVFEAEGISVHTGQFASGISFGNDEFTITLPDGTAITGEKLLVATGRQTFLDDLGVTALGLDEGLKFLKTDGRQRVVEGLWAVGDIAGDGLFTHLATRQADVATDDILGLNPDPLNLEALSAVTFTDPEIGTVGVTEAEAREQGVNVSVGFKPVGHTARGWLHSVGNEGFIKIIIDNDSDSIIGATSVGPVGGEVLGLLALAVHAKIPVSTVRSMIYAYPTFHKGIEDALKEV